MTTQTDEPDWLKNHKAGSKAPVKTTKRTHLPPSPERPRGGFAPGVSGNPKGRPKGIKDKRTLILQEFEKDGSAIARQVIEAAKSGDMQAATLVLSRISPPLKARTEKVQFALDPDGPLTLQAQQVIAAVAEGKVAPDTGKVLMDCIAALAGIKGTDELEARLNELEAQMTKRN